VAAATLLLAVAAHAEAPTILECLNVTGNVDVSGWG